MKENRKRVAALLLSAGGSSRMGHPKQLIEIDNVSLIKRAAQTAISSCCDHLYVIVGAQNNAIRNELAEMDVTIVPNPNWQKGIGSSIHIGIRAIKSENDSIDAVIILLVDQPAVNVSLLNQLTKKFENGSTLVASSYADTIGVPALFSRTYFNELENLPNEQGAKCILKKYIKKVTKISFDKGVYDIDEPMDLERIISIIDTDSKT